MHVGVIEFGAGCRYGMHENDKEQEGNRERLQLHHDLIMFGTAVIVFGDETVFSRAAYKQMNSVLKSLCSSFK